MRIAESKPVYPEVTNASSREHDYAYIDMLS